MSDTTRCNAQKSNYVPEWPPESFTVPMLAKRIPELFRQFVFFQTGSGQALDAGCGMQPFRTMIESAGFAYTGLDAIQNRAGAVDVLGLIDKDLPVELMARCHFDFILCTEVLEHVAGWEKAYSNFASLLAPGGRLLLTIPHFYPLHEVPYDFWRPTPYAVEHFAKASGLNVVHLEMAGGPWEVLGTLLAETHCYPATNKILDRFLAKLGRIVRNVFYSVLMSKWVKSRATLRGPYFLAVYAVLEKPINGNALRSSSL